MLLLGVVMVVCICLIGLESFRINFKTKSQIKAFWIKFFLSIKNILSCGRDALAAHYDKMLSSSFVLDFKKEDFLCQ